MIWTLLAAGAAAAIIVAAVAWGCGAFDCYNSPGAIVEESACPSESLDPSRCTTETCRESSTTTVIDFNSNLSQSESCDKREVSPISAEASGATSVQSAHASSVKRVRSSKNIPPMSTDGSQTADSDVQPMPPVSITPGQAAHQSGAPHASRPLAEGAREEPQRPARPY